MPSSSHTRPIRPDDSSPDLERFRDYLKWLAQLKLHGKIRLKVDSSDLVQQTMMEAHRHRGNFVGSDPAQVAAWLRKILASRLANALRDLQAGKRDVAREQSLQADLDQSSARLENWLVSDFTAPSQRVQKHEQMERMIGVLSQLSDKQREAVLLRYCEDKTLQEIADHLDCSPAAVVGFLRRGTDTLRKLLGGGEEKT